MKPHLERRQSNRDPNDILSPECLALLVSCGDQIRATDQIPTPPVVTPLRHSRRRDDRDDEYAAPQSAERSSVSGRSNS